MTSDQKGANCLLQKKIIYFNKIHRTTKRWHNHIFSLLMYSKGIISLAKADSSLHSKGCYTKIITFYLDSIIVELLCYTYMRINYCDILIYIEMKKYIYKCQNFLNAYNNIAILN
ncbi:hypothetical protein IEQ34_014777 [Dendrobium chrysotoxum]|uniref:Uncharacterized protein n=1 Tax=Dendrobium chrysotoxum TaxID=161865 RepID=A0AAV7G448_DENCH|nr:hypothetical protein IEQ34_014777 [Dendrobium chrysotoxum]